MIYFDVVLCPRTKEQTCPTGAEAEATGPTSQILEAVERADAPANAGPPQGPLGDALTPVRAKTPSELPQSSEAPPGAVPLFRLKMPPCYSEAAKIRFSR